jgi:XTP/dITP diphosphohydrolase
MIDLIFGTQNPNKVAEIQQLVPDSIRVRSLADIGLFDDIPEEQNTLEGNAIQKSQYVFDRFKCNVFSDDTGLEVDVLNGEPGVFSARYAGPQKNSEDNMNKLLLSLKNETNRNARFRTVIALFWNQKLHLFEGIVNGEIAKERRGSKGFGYDPIFIPNGYNQSFAEMPSVEKNKISHRGNAAKQLISFLEENT